MPRRIITAFMLCTLLAAMAAIAAGTGEQDQPRNIVLIGWDGAAAEPRQGVPGSRGTPYLKKLSAEGTLVAIDILRTTDTKSGWTQILTGYEPEITGVYSNGRYQPIPKGYTVFERLEQAFGDDNITTMAVIGKKGHVDADPPRRVPFKPGMEERLKQEGGASLVTENGVKYMVVPGKPYYHTQEGMDLFLNGLNTNEAVGAKTLELLEQNKEKRFFFFVHFAEVDHKGHRFGENSKEYNEALISSDQWTGKIHGEAQGTQTLRQDHHLCHGRPRVRRGSEGP